MTLIEIFAILIIHWIADFWLQTDEMAKGKSSSWKHLLNHTWRYSWIWVFGMWLLLAIDQTQLSTNQIVVRCFLFGGITFVAHTITDYFTSRLNKRLLPESWTLRTSMSDDEILAFRKKDSWQKFFIGIGGDQILHYIQLFLTYKLLS